MLYDWDHKAEINDEIRAEWDQAGRERAEAPPPPFLARPRARGTA